MRKISVRAANTINDLVPGFTPQIGIILGSGLGEVTDALTNVSVVEYRDIPGFPPCGVKGHAGQIHLGWIGDLPVACLSGRAHLYEGFSLNSAETPIEQLMTPVRTLKLLGCQSLIVTNAAGSIRSDLKTGSLMLINDHINFQFTTPLVGPNDEEFGPRFVSMEDAYDPELRKQLAAIAMQNNIPVGEGVYIGVLGPSFETPAEIRMFRQWGADAVGMSTIIEVITARHAGLKVAAISAITNQAVGLSETPVTHELTLQGAKQAARYLSRLILEFLKQQKVTKK